MTDPHDDPAKNPMLPVNVPEMHLEGERLESDIFLMPMMVVGEVDKAKSFLANRYKWALYAEDGEFKGTMLVDKAGHVVVEAAGEVKALASADEEIKELVRRDVGNK